MTEQKLSPTSPASPRDEQERTAGLAGQDRPVRRERQALDERRRRNVVSPGYVRANRPEDGLEVTFVPGELLPSWAADALDGGRFEREAEVIRLTPEPTTSADESAAEPAGRRSVS